jgi:hypothetical protein
MQKTGTVLIVDDDAQDAGLVRELIDATNPQLSTVSMQSGEGLIAYLVVLVESRAFEQPPK